MKLTEKYTFQINNKFYKSNNNNNRQVYKEIKYNKF